MTFTFPLINLARMVLILADGATKQPIIEAIRQDGDAAAQYPVSRVRPAGHLTWLVGDGKAGSREAGK
jgi:6-phosphogluconolactonase/glucosamine-6-phosphate isomerase/deaminase